MKDLLITTVGIKGGAVKQQRMGFISAWSGNEKIMSVDNYVGFGDTYKQRETAIICIFNNGDCIFEGTHEQLLNKLKS